MKTSAKLVGISKNSSHSDRVVVLPDIHVPNHNRAALAAILAFIRSYKPTVLIQLGDFCDWDSVSTHAISRESDIVKINHEIEESNKLLDLIDLACGPKCRKVMIAGNHEARYERFKVNHGFELSIRRMKDFGTWYEEYQLHKRGWEWKPNYGDIFQLNEMVIFTHGWASSGNHAQKHLHMFHKNIIYGHSHQWQVACGTGLDGLPVMGASIGTLSNTNLSYLVGKPPVNWVTMFMTLDFMEDGSFTPHFIPIINGKFSKNGVTYGG